MSKKFRTFLLSLTNCPNTPHKNLHIFKYAYVYIYVVYKQSMYIFVLCVSLVNCLNPKKVPKAFLDFFGFLLFRMCSRSVPIMFPSSSQCVLPTCSQQHTFCQLCPMSSSWNLYRYRGANIGTYMFMFGVNTSCACHYLDLLIHNVLRLSWVKSVKSKTRRW